MTLIGVLLRGAMRRHSFDWMRCQLSKQRALCVHRDQRLDDPVRGADERAEFQRPITAQIPTQPRRPDTIAASSQWHQATRAVLSIGVWRDLVQPWLQHKGHRVLRHKIEVAEAGVRVRRVQVRHLLVKPASESPDRDDGELVNLARGSPLDPSQAFLEVVGLLLTFLCERHTLGAVEVRHVASNRVEVATDDVGEHGPARALSEAVVQPLAAPSAHTRKEALSHKQSNCSALERWRWSTLRTMSAKRGRLREERRRVPPGLALPMHGPCVGEKPGD
eukprot:CAMPEP_0195617290 /NCGR_PEP_ID=MMETSP0815-20121206/13472_1 /TAXON_ID=97485 /ORGANISM="Prymnesium parvum, Strain Texoma1" /LENGTH=276 /DNA_ID=CAMNT_0040757753 /DNA_START=162 /DNA_END=991 /DNA_ORIENTATION=+